MLTLPKVRRPRAACGPKPAVRAELEGGWCCSYFCLFSMLFSPSFAFALLYMYPVQLRKAKKQVKREESARKAPLAQWWWYRTHLPQSGQYLVLTGRNQMPSVSWWLYRGWIWYPGNSVVFTSVIWLLILLTFFYFGHELIVSLQKTFEEFLVQWMFLSELFS